MSNLLRFFLLSCGALILLAIVFQPAPEPPKPPPVPPPGEQTVEPAPHPANAFGNLNTQEVADLERAVAQNAEDVESRKKLLIYYSPSRQPVQDAQALIAGRRHHILWMIEHHPDDLQAFALGAVIYPSPRDLLADPEGYSAAKALWLDHLNKPDPPAAVLSNAATFLEVADKPLVEEIYLRGRCIRTCDGPHGWANFTASSWWARTRQRPAAGCAR